MTFLEVDTLESLQAFVGQTVAVSDWLAVTQDRIERFADVTDDRQWIHVDPDRAARESPYGSTVAHGFLTLSLLSQFARPAIRIRDRYAMAVNYGLNRVRFPAPVRAADRIRARFGLDGVERFDGGVQVVWSVVVELEHSEKPCCAAEWVVRYYERAIVPSSSPDGPS